MARLLSGLISEPEIHSDKHSFCLYNDLTNSPCLSLSTEIEKIQKDEDKEDEKFIDVVINKNMKLGQKILIPVKQFPKVSTTKSFYFFNCVISYKRLHPTQKLATDFLKEVSSAHRGCIYVIKKYCKNSNIVKKYYSLK